MTDRRIIATISLCMVELGVLLFVIGFSTTAWIKTPQIESGLWKTCLQTPSGKMCESTMNTRDPVWQVAVGLQCLALVMYVISGILAICLVLAQVTEALRAWPRLEKMENSFKYGSLATSAVTAMCIFITVTIFIVEQSYSLRDANYSFGLTVTSGVLAAVNGMYLLCCLPSAGKGMNLPKASEKYEIMVE